MFTQAREHLALGLLQIGAIKFGAFRLKLHDKKPTAPLSPIYIDLRILRSFPKMTDSAVEVYRELIEGIKFDIYADVPTAATPVVAVLSHQTRIPMISPRAEAKKHGLKSRIDGVFQEGQVVVLIDDLITRADSKLEAIAILKESGLVVHNVVVLIDREQGGAEELARQGYSCRVAFRVRELLKLYAERTRITQEQYLETIDYLERSA
jgi:uridine monophosphate synthetase